MSFKVRRDDELRWNVGVGGVEMTLTQFVNEVKVLTREYFPEKLLGFAGNTRNLSVDNGFHLCKHFEPVNP